MRHRTKIMMFVIFVLVIGWQMAEKATFAEQEAPPATVSAADPARFVAYYFYTTYRCASCERIEAWSGETVKTRFADALSSGTLAWRSVNTDEPGNKHFVKDFDLYTKSLVIVEQKDGKPVRWKNLDKVWQHLRDQEKFTAYVAEEMKAFMENS